MPLLHIESADYDNDIPKFANVSIFFFKRPSAKLVQLDFASNSFLCLRSVPLTNGIFVGSFL